MAEQVVAELPLVEIPEVQRHWDRFRMGRFRKGPRLREVALMDYFSSFRMLTFIKVNLGT